MPNISKFGDIYSLDPEGDVDLELYLEEVQNGHWEEYVHRIRKLRDEKLKDKMKLKIPRVTFSGIFSVRADNGLLAHSGIIAIDLDDLEDPEATKDMLRDEKYVYAAFRSTGGHGLTVLFKINPQKHRESYLGISTYLLQQYGLLTDPGSISPVKPFGVTFDPSLFINDKKVPVFNLLPKERKVEKLANFAFAEDDFKNILNQVVTRQINLCENYDEWLKIGFAFADKFGEGGRDYFHMVSQVSAKYNKKKTDDQYKYCLRSKKLKIASISTFYWYCKQAGLQITSPRTTIIRKATVNGKAAGLKKEQIIENLKKFENIEGADEIVSDVFDSAYEGDGDSQIEQLEIFVSSNYVFRRNSLTRYLEQNGKDVSQSDMNSVYIAAKKHIDKLNYDLVDRLLLSDFIKSFNPILEYFETLPIVKADENNTPLIDKLSKTLINDIPQFTSYFMKKWLVSIISAAHGEHSPLVFVLLGAKQGKGKTEWFRRLIPQKLRRYYAESKLDAGKDDDILMTQKLIIMDDELSGKSKKEIQRLKELTSKQHFSLREPYGRTNVDLMRLAVLCGTSNFKEVLHDPTGNRRIIPVPVDDVDKELFNSIDKDLLFAEMYALYKTGFNWRVISKDDVEYLGKYESEYEALNLERELLEKFFKPGDEIWLSASEIKVELEDRTRQKLSLEQIGRQLSKIGYVRKTVRMDYAGTAKKWGVERINRGGTDGELILPNRGGFTPAVSGKGNPF